MKIVQIYERLSYGDGVSNCILSISEILDELNYPNNIITFYGDKRIKNEHIIEKEFYNQIDIDADDIVMYHFSIGSQLNYIIENLSVKKILVYHNVTEPVFFRGINDELVKACLWGLYDASKTAGRYLKSIVLSEFSKSQLVEMGWKAEDILVMPLIRNDGERAAANQKIVDRYHSDGYVNVLFTGRMAPHKKIEDIIRIFSYYQKHFNNKSRLILTGETGFANYYEALIDYIQILETEDVIFSGHVSDEDLEAYYAVADIFLCMSEHEGFCIPLVEAMKREIPIIAFSAAAVPDTLGGSGILVNVKDEKEIACNMNRLIVDFDYKRKIIDSQNKRVNSLGLNNYIQELKGLIEETAQIKTYSYSFEKQDIFVSYNVKSSKPAYINDLKKLSEKKEQVIVYGIGKVGKNLVRECEEDGYELTKKIIICDNAFEKKEYHGIPVMKHEECVKKYPHALYIITVQNACVEIIANLIGSNIGKNNIKFLNCSARKLV